MLSKGGTVPMILAVLLSGIVAFLLTQLHFSLFIKPSMTAVKAPPLVHPSPLPHSSAAPLLAKVPQSEGLRVSNRSPYPVRVVLRRHRGSLPDPTPLQSPYTDAVHWDFAPREGSQSGLPVSVQQDVLRLQPGDLLMAFALDGSRRYWGPYVVGQTLDPINNVSSSEWQLILRP
ncbi:MAG: hypothetical protein HC934_13555 [Acaryochloridaceae cyanobacterium SU_2_1]|nr:hypothetical protein [Acaryochloridaceae cyanobacterium SU_2_1]